MNVNDKNIEPVTDLRLALGYSNQCIQRRLGNDSGAGANAGSVVDMTFVATDPLSELVWSPQKGLSLKCADCSFAKKKSSLLWGAGPSNMVVSPPQSIAAGRSSTEKPINEENLISQEAFHSKSEDDGRDTLARSSRSDDGIMPVCGLNHEHRTGTDGYMEEMNPVEEVSLLLFNQKDNLKNCKGEEICGPIDIQWDENSEASENNTSSVPDGPKADASQNDPPSGDPTSGGRVVGSGNQTLRTEIVLASQVHPTNECQPYEKSASFMEKESKDNVKKTDFPIVPPSEKLESTAENDLRTLISENACAAPSKILASEFAHEVEKGRQQDKEILPRGKTIPDKHSPTNSRIPIDQRKGKAKALSDGDVSGRMSKEEDDSHESVESCNSFGLFSTGKKRCRVEQQLFLGNKKLKKEIQKNPGSSSFVKQDSSFVNWISNMMKGFLKSNQNEAPSVALALAHTSQGHEHPDQNPRCSNMGFQSIFQSLYCPKIKVQETRTLDGNYQTELELADKGCDINATPISYCRKDNNFYKQYLLSNEKFNDSTSANGAGMAMQYKILSLNFASSQQNREINCAENKSSCNSAIAKEKDGTSSNTSLGNHKMNSAEDVNSTPPSEGKTAHNFGYRSDPLGSSWITRFTSKTSVPSLNLDYSNQSTSGALEGTTDCMRNIPCSQNLVNFSNDLKILQARQYSMEDPLIVERKELQNCSVNTEASNGFNKIKGHDDQKSIYKLNPILPSTSRKNSEAMASVFARRLDALKHFVPSNVANNAACATITCFFCGRKGHHLQDCSEITATELEDLRGNINLYNGEKELPCLCIRCFQLNHWAVGCPNASLRGQYQSECGDSLVNDCSPSKMQLNSRNDENSKLLDGKESQLQATGAHTVCDGKDSRIADNLNFSRKLNKMATTDKMRYSENLGNKNIASSSGENMLKENHIMQFGQEEIISCNLAERQTSDVPKGIFDAVKTLRLSRTDILKWLNSQASLSNLDGFFLRLRLGKWEEGLGGTGYYVACITGAQRGTLALNSKSSLFVNIGGIKCLVKSQYISNHNFLEDELMAWWCATKRSGGKIPSEENLRLKVEERRVLGL